MRESVSSVLKGQLVSIRTLCINPFRVEIGQGSLVALLLE